MKTLILITLAALFLYGCSKDSTAPKPTPQVTQTWISGKWMRTSFGDTTINRDGTKSFQLLTGANELNFIDTNKVTQSSVAGQTYNYSLSTMTATFDYGAGVKNAVFKITKLSDTKIKLDYIYYSTDINIKELAWVDVYEKE